MIAGTVRKPALLRRDGEHQACPGDVRLLTGRRLVQGKVFHAVHPFSLQDWVHPLCRQN